MRLLMQKEGTRGGFLSGQAVHVLKTKSRHKKSTERGPPDTQHPVRQRRQATAHSQEVPMRPQPNSRTLCCVRGAPKKAALSLLLSRIQIPNSSKATEGV